MVYLSYTFQCPSNFLLTWTVTKDGQEKQQRSAEPDGVRGLSLAPRGCDVCDGFPPTRVLGCEQKHTGTGDGVPGWSTLAWMSAWPDPWLPETRPGPSVLPRLLEHGGALFSVLPCCCAALLSASRGPLVVLWTTGTSRICLLSSPKPLVDPRLREFGSSMMPTMPSATGIRQLVEGRGKQSRTGHCCRTSSLSRQGQAIHLHTVWIRKSHPAPHARRISHGRAPEHRPTLYGRCKPVTGTVVGRLDRSGRRGSHP